MSDSGDSSSGGSVLQLNDVAGSSDHANNNSDSPAGTAPSEDGSGDIYPEAEPHIMAEQSDALDEALAEIWDNDDILELSSSSGDSDELSASAREVGAARDREFPAVVRKGWRDLQTGLVYDARMTAHRSLTDSKHPECPERIAVIWGVLKSAGLVDLCVHVPARDARTKELLTVHSARHIKTVRLFESLTDLQLTMLQRRLNSVYLNGDSARAAALSCGSLTELTLRVARGEIRNGAAVVRPPGHHAEADRCMGFCLYNNAAVAAAAAQAAGLSRILILDWDVHHGNGTQQMFYESRSVLYVSIHRYDYGTFFPASPDAAPAMVGTGRGLGFNVNIAWNGGDKGDADYIAAFHRCVMPIAAEFAPELVIVSAGFDAAENDPLGGCALTPEGYAAMTHSLMSLAGGKVVVALEGGYNLDSISASMRAVVETLLGKPPPPISWRQMRPRSGSLHDISQTTSEHARFWQSLGEGLPECSDELALLRMASEMRLKRQASDVSADGVVLPLRKRQRGISSSDGDDDGGRASAAEDNAGSSNEELGLDALLDDNLSDGAGDAEGETEGGSECGLEAMLWDEE